MFLIGLISVRAQEEIEYDDQTPHKHHTTQEHQKQAPDMDVLPIGIGWLQKDDKQGDTKGDTCAYATPHSMLIPWPSWFSAALMLVTWHCRDCKQKGSQPTPSKRSPPQAAGLLGTKPIQTKTIERLLSSQGDAV